jgi:hypothetical protein
MRASYRPDVDIAQKRGWEGIVGKDGLGLRAWPAVAELKFVIGGFTAFAGQALGLWGAPSRPL